MDNAERDAQLRGSLLTHARLKGDRDPGGWVSGSLLATAARDEDREQVDDELHAATLLDDLVELQMLVEAQAESRGIGRPTLQHRRFRITDKGREYCWGRRPVLDKPAEIMWIRALANGIGCAPCIAHWHAYVDTNPPTLDTPAEYIRWAWAAQNAVRVRIGKAPWPFDDGPVQPHPLLLRDAAGNAITVDRVAPGRVAALAGNGPSLKLVDPAALAGLDVMAINNAAKVIHPKYWVAGDQAEHFPASIFADQTITKFYPFNRRNEVTEGLKVIDAPNMVYTTVDDDSAPETWLAKRIIAWGVGEQRTSLAIGLRVLIDLGYRTIYFIGVDWAMSEQRPYASADAKYAKGVQQNNELYETWGRQFAALQPELLSHGITVINATPGSRLSAWPLGRLPS